MASPERITRGIACGLMVTATAPVLPFLQVWFPTWAVTLMAIFGGPLVWGTWYLMLSPPAEQRDFLLRWTLYWMLRKRAAKRVAGSARLP